MVASTATAAVLMAATQSVAKVYVIGAVGVVAVKFPRSSPLLPSSAVAILARLSFNVLVIPLVYSTTAISVSPSSINEYWFVLLGAVVVMAISYVLPTVLALCIKIDDPHDYHALRIAATFPNVVALPILMFPSLCEYPFVYNMVVAPNPAGSTQVSDDELRQQCAATSNTIVFVFFFMWSLVFWGLGYPQLLSVARRGNQRREGGEHESARIADGAGEGARNAVLDVPPSFTSTGDHNATENVTSKPSPGDMDGAADSCPLATVDSKGTGTLKEAEVESRSKDLDAADERTRRSEVSGSSGATSTAAADSSREPSTLRDRMMSNRWVKAVVRTVTSPGFLALAAGFATGCIPPLKSALFDSGGALRFLGSALETLGLASNSISTMVVAASLVPPPPPPAPAMSPTRPSSTSPPAEPPTEVSVCRDGRGRDSAVPSSDPDPTRCDVPVAGDLMEPEDNPIMSDPTFGPYRRRQRRRSSIFIERTQSVVRRQSARFVESLSLRTSPEMRRLLIWFTLSRLVLAPAVVIGLIVTLDCTTNVLSSVPALAKLVVIFNSSVPGAMIVVVLLKAQPHLSRTAAAISKVYLPTYLLAIFTMAGWTTLGLLVTIPTSPDDPTPMICSSRW